MPKLILSALIAAILVPVLAYSQTTPNTGIAMPKERMQRNLKQMDANKDEVISKAEFMADAEKRFARIDADNDQKITKDELAAMANKGRQSTQYP